MKDYLSGVVILSLIYKSFARSETAMSRYYKEKSEFIDEVFSAQPIVERGPVTLIECASKCKRCCTCFGFNTLPKSVVYMNHVTKRMSMEWKEGGNTLYLTS